jgi:hypothetical protein
MGESGGEKVMFNIAGKEVRDDLVEYANTTSTILDNKWKRYEVVLADSNLQSISHVFGVEVNSRQTLRKRSSLPLDAQNLLEKRPVVDFFFLATWRR